MPKLNHSVLTACFAMPIPQCGGGLDFVDSRRHIPRPPKKITARHKHKQRHKEEGVTKHVAAAVARRSESLISKDDDSATLLTEVDLSGRARSESSTDTESVSSDSSEGESYSSNSRVGASRLARHLSDFVGNINDNINEGADELSKLMNGGGATEGSGALVSPTGSNGSAVYKGSLKGKFDYMRLHQQFSVSNGQDPPCDASIVSFKSIKADEASMDFMKWGIQQRRNQLAKQILQRRQNVANSRTGFDP